MILHLVSFCQNFSIQKKSKKKWKIQKSRKKNPEQKDLVEQEGEDSAACEAKMDENDLIVTNSLK